MAGIVGEELHPVAGQVEQTETVGQVAGGAEAPGQAGQPVVRQDQLLQGAEGGHVLGEGLNLIAGEVQLREVAQTQHAAVHLGQPEDVQ